MAKRLDPCSALKLLSQILNGLRLLSTTLSEVGAPRSLRIEVILAARHALDAYNSLSEHFLKSLDDELQD